jgi:hypothetical protein
MIVTSIITMCSTYEYAAERGLLYQPVEELKNWAKDNKGRLPADQVTKLKGIINAIEHGPGAGKPLPISSLRDHQIRKLFLGSGMLLSFRLNEAETRYTNPER